MERDESADVSKDVLSLLRKMRRGSMKTEKGPR